MGTCGMLSIYKFMQLNSIRRSSKWSQSHEESSSYIHHACMNGKEADFKGQQTLKEYISSTARIDSAAANRLAIWFSAYIYKHTPNSSSPVRITTSSMCVQCIHKFCCKSNWVWLYAYILLQQIKLGMIVCRHSVAAIELGMIVCIQSVALNRIGYDHMHIFFCCKSKLVIWLYDCLRLLWKVSGLRLWSRVCSSRAQLSTAVESATYLLFISECTWFNKQQNQPTLSTTITSKRNGLFSKPM